MAREWIGRRLLRVFREFRHLGYRVAAARRRSSARVFGVILRLVHGPHVSFRAVESTRGEQGERWADKGEGPVRLSIVVVSYKQPMALQCLLSSLAAQVLQNFEVLVYHDGPDAETRAVAERFCRTSDRFRYHETAVRHDDWGHSLRALGVEEAGAEFIHITNGDNYYVPRFTEFAFEAVDEGRFDMLLWNLVHSYSSPGQRTLRCYTPFRVFPAKYVVDMAAVMVRTALAKRVGFTDRAHTADASFVEAVLGLAGAPIRVGKIEKTLAVHN